MSLEVTDVKIRKLQGKSKIVAFATVVVDNAVCIDGIKIINGEKGMFIAMPSTQFSPKGSTEKKWKDIVFPINSEARKVLTDAILASYNKVKEDEPF